MKAGVMPGRQIKHNSEVLMSIQTREHIVYAEMKSNVCLTENTKD